MTVDCPKPGCPLPRLLWWIACIVCIVAIAGGIGITGGPQSQRLKNQDLERVNRLQSLSQAIEQFAVQHRRLPENLDELTREETLYLAPSILTDPVSRKQFTYMPQANRYRLCAVFATNTQPRQEADHQAREEYKWTHPRGKHCIAFDAPYNINRREPSPR